MKKIEITGAALKITALLTMVIDHIGGVLLENMLYNNPGADALSESMTAGLQMWDSVLRSIGRLSFPLFVFLLVEGFFFTGSRKKHLLRLVLFCFISEPFYDMAFMTDEQILSGHFWQMGQQNVFFTLAAGFLVMMVIERVRRVPAERMCLLLKAVLCTAVTAFFAWLAWILHFDYGAVGVLVIVFAYFCRWYGKKDFEIPVIVLPLYVLWDIELFALADWILVYFYHGKKGRSLPKWFFYLFYPAHLGVLAGIRLLLV